MYIIAIGWIYVVLMMSITEASVVAGIMTFVLYGILPLTIILYVMSTPRRRRRRATREAQARENQADTQKPGAHAPADQAQLADTEKNGPV